MVCPLMDDAKSLAKNAVTAPTSPLAGVRRSGAWSTAYFRILC